MWSLKFLLKIYVAVWWPKFWLEGDYFLQRIIFWALTVTSCAKFLGFFPQKNDLAKLIQLKNRYKKFLLMTEGKFEIETKRNELKTKRNQNENETERSWVAVWWPKVGGMSGSPGGGRNFGRNLGRFVVAEISVDFFFPPH